MREMASEQFSLCWDNFHKNMSSGMNSLLEHEDFVDVTLAIDGKYLKAHKMVLSVCSPYFRELFKMNPCQHPIVFMKDVSYTAMCDLIQFMYQGEVQISQENLTTFIKTAEALQIKGLTDGGNSSVDSDQDDLNEVPEIELQKSKKTQSSQIIELTTPPAKRQRINNNNSNNQTSQQHRQNDEEISKTESSITTDNSNNDNNSTIITTTTPQNKEEIVQFKLEPYDQNQSITINDDNDEVSFNDDPLDDKNGDADVTDDYSIIEGGDDEPKAGTSDEMPGEGQEARPRRKKNMPRYIVDGFVFHVNITKGEPPMMYLRCLEYKRLGCHARAVIPYDGSIGDIKISKPHNHPPDFAAEEKIIFMRELEEVMRGSPNVSPKTVYTTLSEMYPNAARETPFDMVKHKLNRWRRQSDNKIIKIDEV